MKKLIKDLLQSPSGKFSRKSFMIMITFFFTLALGTYIVLAEVLNTYASGIFDSLLIFLTAIISGSIYDKKVANKSIPNVTEEPVNEEQNATS